MRRFSRRAVLGGLAAGAPVGAVRARNVPMAFDSLLERERRLRGLEDGTVADGPPYAAEMRAFVMNLSGWSRALRPDFAVVAMNGLELTVYLEDSISNDRNEVAVAQSYLRALDGVMIEGLYAGLEEYDRPTPAMETERFLGYAGMLKDNGLSVLSLDYAAARERIGAQTREGAPPVDLIYVAEGAQRRLDRLARFPARPPDENHLPVFSLKDARNYAMVIESRGFGTRRDFIAALQRTNYDLLIVDPFHGGREPLTYRDMRALRHKRLGTRRLLFAYVNIGTAEPHRHYWGGDALSPDLLGEPVERPRRGDEYQVRYWEPRWQNVFFGHDGSYLTGILRLGFDGVVLGNVDAFLTWQEG